MKSAVARVHDIAVCQHGAFSRRQLVASGVNREMLLWQLHTGAWVQQAYNVFVVAGSPDTWLQRLWCAYLEAGPESAISHRAAAQLLRLPGYTSNAVDVSVWETRHHRLTLGTLHLTAWLPPTHITTIDGLPVTRIARCVFDLAGEIRLSKNPEIRLRQEEMHLKRVRRIFNNSLLHCGNSVEDQIHVVTTLKKRGRSGTAVMRTITAELAADHAPTESELEDLFLDTCRAFDLDVPECQINLGVDRPEGKVDFYFRAARLIVEVDSRWHDTPDNRADDAWRDLRFAAMGIQVIRIRWRNLILDPERVMRDLAAAIAVRAAS